MANGVATVDVNSTQVAAAQSGGRAHHPQQGGLLAITKGDLLSQPGFWVVLQELEQHDRRKTSQKLVTRKGFFDRGTQCWVGLVQKFP